VIDDPRPKVDARFSRPDAKPTPWPQVRDLLERAELFWISTVRENRPPHVAPLPAVWFDDALHFCTGAEEQKGVNLARNPSCALTTGNNTWKTGLDVVVEGRAERVVDDERLHQLAALWFSKYDGDWDYEVRNHAFHHDAGEALVFRVAATKILAFAKGDFAQTAYRFEDAEGSDP
jgi:nitroimidazol reductase NimA-like FMN-containing flavoprotein (pyridoxamine 5'-phosphate oxidase superfamily)